jgi:methionyl-tRNA formyltransferase
MNIVVFSSTAFGLHCIEQAINKDSSVKISGIVTTGDEISISYAKTTVQISTHADFHHIAHSTGSALIRYDQTTPDELHARLSALNPDLILVLGWYYKVSSRIRSLPPKGCLGIHASMLPKYRGGAPISWAIINGEIETGVTLFELVEETDAGDIIAQARIPITADDSWVEVYQRATEASVEILRKQLPLIGRGNMQRCPQDSAQATYFPQRGPEDGEIFWGWPARRIHDFVRAQTHPYPGAYTLTDNGKMTLLRTTVAAEMTNESPGARIRTKHNSEMARFACGDNRILIVTNYRMEKST